MATKPTQAMTLQLLKDLATAMEPSPNVVGTLWPAPFEPREHEHGYWELLTRTRALIQQLEQSSDV